MPTVLMYEIRFYLSGPAEAWEPLDWRLRDDLMRLKDSGLRISFVVPEDALAQLAPSQRDELAALAAVAGAEVYLPTSIPETGEADRRLFLAMEMGNDQHAIRWAASNAEALVPTAYWGNGECGAQFVRVSHDHPLPPMVTTWSHKTAVELRSVPGTFSEISITTEFDGSHRQFGQRAWQRICEQVPLLQQQLAGDQPLAELHYSDRYLRSPLTVLLLKELVGALANYPGGLVPNTRVTVQDKK